MKDFTTQEYIEPIIAYFKALYTPIKDKVVLDALSCDVLLQNNHSRNAITIRANDVFYTSCMPYRELMQEVNDYTRIASTYDGELDAWTYNEEQRIQNAIRDRLIELYA